MKIDKYLEPRRFKCKICKQEKIEIEKDDGWIEGFAIYESRISYEGDLIKETDYIMCADCAKKADNFFEHLIEEN